MKLPRDEGMGEDDYIWATAVAPRGKVIVTQTEKPPELWQLETNEKLCTLGALAGEDIVSMAVTPNGRQLLCGRYEGPLELWDLGKEKKLRTLCRHSSEEYVVAITPDGKHGLAVVSGTRMKMSQLDTGKLVRTFPCSNGRHINSLAVTADGSRVIAGGDGSVQVWEL